MGLQLPNIRGKGRIWTATGVVSGRFSAKTMDAQKGPAKVRGSESMPVLTMDLTTMAARLDKLIL